MTIALAPRIRDADHESHRQETRRRRPVLQPGLDAHLAVRKEASSRSFSVAFGP